MTPYSFYMLNVRQTKELYNIKKAGFKLSLAKRTLNHLYEHNWTDDDIVILIHKMCDTLKRAYIVPTFSYICGILLKTDLRPSETMSSVKMDKTFEQWAKAEIERLSKEMNNAN